MYRGVGSSERLVEAPSIRSIVKSVLFLSPPGDALGEFESFTKTQRTPLEASVVILKQSAAYGWLPVLSVTDSVPLMKVPEEKLPIQMS